MVGAARSCGTMTVVGVLAEVPAKGTSFLAAAVRGPASVTFVDRPWSVRHRSARHAPFPQLRTS